jgi:serine/threonine protein phosphatase 1
MGKRVLVIGDIHGGFKALLQILDRSGTTADDCLVFLGDYVDGWSESPQLIDFLIELNNTHECIFLRGNHEELLLDWLKYGKENEKWLFYGGDTTIKAYEDISNEIKSTHIGFIESLEDYYLDKKNRLFLHAGFTHINGVENEYFPRLLQWDRSLWEMALALDPKLSVEDKYYPERLKLYDEIYIGHTPTTRIGKTTPVNAASVVWNLDTGAGFTGPLTIMDVETKQYWQSDLVSTLYATESTRKSW